MWREDPVRFWASSTIPSSSYWKVSCVSELVADTCTVQSKSSWTKMKYFLAISKNVLILNALYKQWRAGPTKRWAGSSIHIVWYPAPVFAENWLYRMGLLDFCGFILLQILQIVQELLEGTVCYWLQSAVKHWHSYLYYSVSAKVTSGGGDII